jgi:hypothetical protein
MATRIKHMLAHYRPKDQNSISPWFSGDFNK